MSCWSESIVGDSMGQILGAVETMEAVPVPQEAHCAVVLSSWMHALNEIGRTERMHDLTQRLAGCIDHAMNIVKTYQYVCNAFE